MQNKINELSQFGETLLSEGYVLSSPLCEVGSVTKEEALKQAVEFSVKNGFNYQFARMDDWTHPYAGILIGVSDTTGKRIPPIVKEFLFEEYGLPSLDHWQIYVYHHPFPRKETTVA